MSDWIKHIKETREKEGCSYKEAMIKAKGTYTKKQKGQGETKVETPSSKEVVSTHTAPVSKVVFDETNPPQKEKKVRKPRAPKVNIAKEEYEKATKVSCKE